MQNIFLALLAVAFGLLSSVYTGRAFLVHLGHSTDEWSCLHGVWWDGAPLAVLVIALLVLYILWGQNRKGLVE